MKNSLHCLTVYAIKVRREITQFPLNVMIAHLDMRPYGNNSILFLIVDYKECAHICVNLIQEVTKCRKANNYQFVQSQLLSRDDYNRNLSEAFSPQNRICWNLNIRIYSVGG